MAKILIVDDNPTNRSFLITLLHYGGHALREASDGAEALALVSSERPDLVIADVLMPTMDGYEFVRRLRSTVDIAHTPVIFCSAHYRDCDAKDLARECGVTHVLSKPCEPALVLKAVDECLASKPASPISPINAGFDREHLRLMTDKLSAQTTELKTGKLRLQILLNIILQLSKERDSNRLLDRLSTAARGLIAARYSLVSIPSHASHTGVRIAFSGVVDIQYEADFSTTHDLFARVMENRQTIRIVNPSGDPTAFGLPATLRSFESLLVAPIVSPYRAYGWLGLFHRIGAIEFGEEDERLVTILAALAGCLYENGLIHSTQDQSPQGIDVVDRTERQGDCQERFASEIGISSAHKW